jgi:hypothetical protein
MFPASISVLYGKETYFTQTRTNNFGFAFLIANKAFFAVRISTSWGNTDWMSFINSEK